MTLATTDPNLATIFMSRSLSGALLMKVLIHELGHCALVSYGLLDDIHKVVKPEYWILDISRRMGLQLYSRLWS